MASISQVSEALEIIKNVKSNSERVWVNKIQCKRVADRFGLIGEGLSVYTTPDCDGSALTCPAFDDLLIVLRKGQALVSKYVEWAGIMGVLSWSDNRKAFKEIHDELDTMKKTFPFNDFNDQFETSSGLQRAKILIQDAKQDLMAVKSLSQSQSLQPKTDSEELEQVVKVVLEKTTEPSGSLPSYIQIDFAAIDITDPIRVQELRSEHAGARAVVCKGSWLSCDFAVKVFKSEFFEWNKDQMLKEVGALMELRHPHIVRFIGFAQGTEFCAVLMELMPEKDLRHYMETHAPGRRPFTRSEELDIITQIAKGMLYLHTQGYVHGDLRCSNILVKKQGKLLEVKIGDLRYAQKLESAGGSSEFEKKRRPVRWSPPEALEKYAPTEELLRQADVYSFAMTCCEVVTGKWPFDGIRDKDGLNEKIKNGERPPLPADLHEDLKGLIDSCWANDPIERPSFENICHILELIRPSKTFSIAPLWTTAKQIPKALGLIRVLQQHPSATTSTTWTTSNESTTRPTTWTTWNENTTRPSEREPGADGVIKLSGCLHIKFEDLKRVRKVGKGAFATVYEAKWLGATFAVKRIKDASVSGVQKELDFLIQLSHPYIIQLVGFSVDKKERCLIVMEFMEGSLRELINSRIQKSRRTWSTSKGAVHLPLNEVEELSIITKLAQGMSYLHCKGVMHRDLKARNVLCQDHGGSLDVKIVDFGVSQFIATAGEAASWLGVGTGFWRAPEILPTAANRSRQEKVDLMAVDVYSFAMTCYEIVTGLKPFKLEFGDAFYAHYDDVVRGDRPELPDTLNAELRHLINDCWHTDPAERPDFAKICKDLGEICDAKKIVPL